MDFFETLNQRYDDLIVKISNQKKFGLKCEEEQSEVQEIEATLMKRQFEKLNEGFIVSQNWKENYLTGAYPWDIIIYNNKICRAEELAAVSYNEGSDTFNYEAYIVELFSNEKYKVNFGFYDRVKFLAY